MSSPTVCPSGDYQASTGQTSCDQCPAGSECSDTTTAAACPSNKYSLAGSVNCSECPAGQVVNGGQTGCDDCTAGNYRSSSNSSCQTCPAGISFFNFISFYREPSFSLFVCHNCKIDKTSIINYCLQIALSNELDFAHMLLKIYSNSFHVFIHMSL